MPRIAATTRQDPLTEVLPDQIWEHRWTGKRITIHRAHGEDIVARTESRRSEMTRTTLLRDYVLVRTQPDYRADRNAAARNLLAHLNEAPAFMRTPEGKRVKRWEAGNFVSRLIDLLLVSDQANRALLAIGFPAYVWAVATYKDEPDGLTILAEFAGWEAEKRG